MKKIWKRTLCFVLVLALLAGMSVCFAGNDGKQYHNYGTYVLLGDSIAAGYSDVEPVDCEFTRVEGSYSAIVADTIGAELIPMACPGFRTIDMRYIFEDDYVPDQYLFHDVADKAAMEARIPQIRQAVADAGLITLGVGGNDVGSYLAWVVTDAMAKGGMFDDFVTAAKELLARAGVEDDNLTALLDLAATMGALPNVIQALPSAIYVAVTTYLNNWNHVIEDIYRLNPDVTLLVTGLFDTGYKTEEDLTAENASSIDHQVAQLIVDMINAPMKAGASRYGYLYIDTSGTLTDVAHPNAAGHQHIAQRILEALPEAGIPFTDVHAGSSAYEAVKYVYQYGIMDGTAETTFSPNASMTRAQAVEALYRMAGSPDVSGLAEPFYDVAADTPSRDAIVWAYTSGIASGVITGALFCPNAAVSRAQLAAMLYRYAGSPAVSGSLKAIDQYLIPPYAREAVLWATVNGVIPASGAAFCPLKAATRAEAACGILQTSTL
ncbi:MAG TPA: S-layer homology domain-containing protein [Candidatus Fimivicinus intestinavium]|nr:S-layer homology domain-containing protein [Candidatus Fimivicinus intestinavium]